jgi:hypothetical protein
VPSRSTSARAVAGEHALAHLGHHVVLVVAHREVHLAVGEQPVQLGDALGVGAPAAPEARARAVEPGEHGVAAGGVRAVAEAAAEPLDAAAARVHQPLEEGEAGEALVVHEAARAGAHVRAQLAVGARRAGRARGVVDERELHRAPRALVPGGVLLEVAGDDRAGAVHVRRARQAPRPRAEEQPRAAQVGERLAVDPHERRGARVAPGVALDDERVDEVGALPLAVVSVTP